MCKCKHWSDHFLSIRRRQTQQQQHEDNGSGKIKNQNAFNILLSNNWLVATTPNTTYNLQSQRVCNFAFDSLFYIFDHITRALEECVSFFWEKNNHRILHTIIQISHADRSITTLVDKREISKENEQSTTLR